MQGGWGVKLVTYYCRKQSNKCIRWVFRASAAEFGEVDIENLYGALLEISDCFAYQKESAPQTGYLHFQGYLELVNKNRHTWIQNHLKQYGYHFEFLQPAKGTFNLHGPIFIYRYSQAGMDLCY